MKIKDIWIQGILFPLLYSSKASTNEYNLLSCLIGYALHNIMFHKAFHNGHEFVYRIHMEFGMLAMYWGGLPFTSRRSGESGEKTV